MKKTKNSLSAILGIITATIAFSACFEKSDNTTNPQTPEVHTTVDISLEQSNEQPSPQQEPQQDPQQQPQQDSSIDAQPEPDTNTSSELTDNPEFLSWAKYGIGTQVTYENTTESQGTTQQSVLTYTLTEKNDDSITYQIQAKTTIDGQDTEIPTEQQSVSSKIPSNIPTRPSQIPGVKIIEEKEEAVSVGDRTLNTSVTKFETQGGEEPHTFSSITTLWESDEVPGRVVRMESITNTDETTHTSTLVLKDLVIK
jgi:hypothetical protein